MMMMMMIRHKDEWGGLEQLLSWMVRPCGPRANAARARLAVAGSMIICLGSDSLR